MRDITSSTEKNWSISGDCEGRVWEQLFLINAEICLVADLPYLERKKKIADAQSNLLSVKQWKMFSISMSQVVFGIYLYIKNTCGLSESQINCASCILSGSPPRQGLRSLL